MMTVEAYAEKYIRPAMAGLEWESWCEFDWGLAELCSVPVSRKQKLRLLDWRMRQEFPAVTG